MMGWNEKMKAYASLFGDGIYEIKTDGISFMKDRPWSLKGPEQYTCMKIRRPDTSELRIFSCTCIIYDGIYDSVSGDVIFGDTDTGNRMMDLILAHYANGDIQ